MVSPVNKFAPDATPQSGIANRLSANADSGSTVVPALAITSVWADEGSSIGEVANGGSTDDRTVRLEGTGIPGDRIVLVHNGINLGTWVGADGHWQYEVLLYTGPNEVVVRSISETTESYFIEYVPPVAPPAHVASVWADEGQVGEIGNGGVTDDRTVFVQGYGTPSTFIWIIVNGQPVDLGFSIDGKWQTELTLDEGPNEIVVWSSQGNSEPFIVDYVPAAVEPPLTAITSVSGAEGQGDIGNGESTGEHLVLIKGTGVPGAQLYIWGVSSGVTNVQVGDDGTWQIYSLLEAGRNEFKVEYDGQTSEPFIVDFVPAVVEPSLPAIISVSGVEGQGDIGNGESIGERVVLIKGTGTPGTQFYLRGVGGSLTSVQVDDNGTWQIYSLLNEGRNEFRAEYKGQSGEPFIVEFVPASAQQISALISEDQSSTLVEPNADQPAFDALFSEPQTLLFVDDAAGLTLSAAPLIISAIDLLGTPDQDQWIQVSDVTTPSIQWLPVDEAQLQAFH